MSDDPFISDRGADGARLADLDARLGAAQSEEAEHRPATTGPQVDASYSMGNRVLAELIAGIGGGALIGWVIDHFAGTAPWGLLAVMGLGIIVAFRSIFRLANRRSS